MDIIEQLKQQFAEKMQNSNTSADMDNLYATYLSKKGLISNLLTRIRELPTEERPTFGAKINKLKEEITAKIAEKKSELDKKALDRQLENAPDVDLTEILSVEKGSLHPITIVQREIEDVFKSMGFAVEDGPEVVTDYENFEAVNIPKDHPARDTQDTFYLDNGQLLKTQTSAMQNKILRKYGAPLRVIFPGRCFRNESVDACHDTTFFQMEGMVVDTDVNIGNMKYFMDTLLERVLHKKIVSRLRPGYFPFTEPGLELDLQCEICGGKGCPTCKNSGWLELLPCGMIHPNVLEMGGLDSKKYTGFAFGLGLTRLAMMKYGVKNIRDLNSGDLKVLKQFTK